MVRAAGLEPALPYGNKILSLACLPIPPRPLVRICVYSVWRQYGQNFIECQLKIALVPNFAHITPMQFSTPLLEGRLIRRYKRFFADIELVDGNLITAHCANTGSMAGLVQAGSRVWVSRADNPKRKLQYDWRIVEVGQETQRALVGVHTAWPNTIVEQALQAGRIPELAGYDIIRREVKYGGNSRIDFLLEHESKPPCYVEVKSITFSRTPGLAEFPDSPSVRAAKHIDELTNMVNDGARAAMFYVVQRDDCHQFAIAADIDPKYYAALKLAKTAGVESLCYACTISPRHITLSHPVRIMDN